jgi:ribonucleoside-diphosphate reductase alpha chain
MIAIGFMPGSEDAPAREGARALAGYAALGGEALPRPAAQCPRCGQASLTRQEGCDLCSSCGYSKCG